MGFDGFFFGRLDYADDAKRKQYKTREMVWRGSESLGSSTDLFTGVLYHLYSPPNGFCFDSRTRCIDQPIMVSKMCACMCVCICVCVCVCVCVYVCVCV